MKIVDAARLAEMAADARRAPRGRTHHTLHDDQADPVQRLVMALQPGTYVRPHRHAGHVWEMFVLLDGTLAVLGFDDDGRVTSRVELRAEGERVVEVPPGAWHSIVALAPDTIVVEVKPGPYVPLTDKHFAAWAPAEGEAAAVAMLRWLEGAGVGERP